MTFSSNYYANYLEDTRITFDNLGKSPQIKEKLVGFGYDDNRIQEGVTLHARAQELFRQHLEKRQEKTAKREQLKESSKQVFKEYIDHVRRLRVELRDDAEATAALSLSGRRERGRAGFIEQAANFYNTTINNMNILEKIQRFGFSLEKLKDGLARFEGYLTLRSEVDKLEGECQRLVEERDKAFRLLKGWLAAFAVTCRVAFGDNPQILEEIGIFVRNRPKTRRKKEEEQNPQPVAGAASPN